jgi:cell division septation protein DedD
LALLVVLVGVVACGKRGGGGGGEVTTVPPADTATVPAPVFRDTAGPTAPPVSAIPDSGAGGLPEPVLSSGHLIAGWRVQIFSSSWLADAEALRDRLRREGLPAYVEYRAPLYRVRIGDCTDLAEARELRDRAIAMGYERASVVQTLIQAPRTAPDSSARP